jgi:hypothetical protein
MKRPSIITRRSFAKFMAAAAAMIFCPNDPAFARPHGGAPGSGSGGYQVTITFPTNSDVVVNGPWSGLASNVAYTYNQSSAVQQSGNYTGPGFVQQSWKSTHPTCPIIVYFRPDTSGGRMEIIFEYGYCGSPVGSGLNNSAYNITPTGYITNINYNNSTGVTTFNLANASSIFSVSGSCVCTGFQGTSGTPAGMNGTWTVTGVTSTTVTVAAPSGLGLPSGEAPESNVWGTIYPPGGSAAAGISYTVNITNNGVPVTGVIGTTAASFPTVVSNPHNWFSRWRWQSAVRPIVNTPSQIISKNLWFNMGIGSLPTPSYLTMGYTYDSPLSNAGVQPGEGGTGSRADIGVITAWAGQWMINPTSTTEQVLRDTSEAAGSIPCNYRDESTGAPLNIVTYPGATYLPGQSYGPAIKNAGGTVGPIISVWGTDIAHCPDLTSILYKATLDPYHLESLQYYTGDGFWQSQYYGGASAGAPLVQPNETRAFAWGFRNLFNAHFCSLLAETYGALPSWICPSSMYATVTNVNQSWAYGSFLSDATPNPNPTTLWGYTVNVGQNEPWQNQWIASAFCMAKLYGLPNCTVSGVPNNATLATGFLGNALMFTTGGTIASGAWPTGLGCPYFLLLDTNNQTILTPNLLPGGDAYNTTTAALYSVFIATFTPKITGAISNGSGGAGTTLTVSAMLENGVSGNAFYNNIQFPCPLFNASGVQICNITGFTSGTSGGVGVYTVDTSLNLSAQTMYAANNNGFFSPASRVALIADQFNGGVCCGEYNGVDWIEDNRSAICMGTQLGLISGTTNIGYINTQIANNNSLELAQYYAA